MKHVNSQRFELLLFNKVGAIGWAIGGVAFIVILIVLSILFEWNDARLNVVWILFLIVTAYMGRVIYTRPVLVTVHSDSLTLEDVSDGKRRHTTIEIRYADIKEYGFKVFSGSDDRLLIIGNDDSRTVINFRRSYRNVDVYRAFQEALPKAISSFDNREAIKSAKRT